MSLNGLSLLGIIGHWTTELDLLIHAVLAIKEVDGEHTGENLALLVWQVLDDYQIKSKVGFFMMDNASNNDTLIQSLSILLTQDSISYNPVFHRL